ncbi:TetR/AcrR family transcriptional regulator [Pseudomonas sp. R2.Fl]|nr:TetR/AcrR family transcriptional regulator [Pseudomonas sp. R2.Fl]
MSEADTRRRTSIGAQRNPASEEAILAAAEAILRESGPQGFSIEAVARRAKAGKPTIYRWWPSKAALLIDVYHRQKALDTPDTGHIEQDLVDFMTSLLGFWRTDGGAIFRSVVAEAQGDPTAAAALTQYASDRREHSGRMILRAQERGEVRADVSPELVAEMLSSFAWSRLLTDRLEISEAEIRTFVGVILSGIRTDVGRQ